MSRGRRAGVASGLAAIGIVVAVIVARPSPSPYVITAIDYHFHDAHPTKPIDVGRTLIVTNQGRALHNVTFPGTKFSRDILPGGRLVIHDVGHLLGPGRHPIICLYHSDVGMSGTVVITG